MLVYLVEKRERNKKCKKPALKNRRFHWAAWVSGGQTGSSRTGRKCLDSQSKYRRQTQRSAYIFWRKVLKNWRTNCSCLKIAQSILSGWWPRWGPTEGRPRSRAADLQTSPSLQEIKHTSSWVCVSQSVQTRKPTSTSPPPTDEVVDALWFFLPVDAQEVDGNAGEHDD